MACTQQKQLVCFPKVRVPKKWFRYFNDHKDFRNEGTLHLFSLIGLYSYANFRSNTRHINGKKYMEGPGQWICKLSALPRVLRAHSKAHALELLDYFKDAGFLDYEMLDEEAGILRYTIREWERHCTHLEYNYYSYKCYGFFFFPIPVGRHLVTVSRRNGGTLFSELDAIMDFWLHTVLNDPQVAGSEYMPVVYYANMKGQLLLSYSYLAKRWGWSKSRVGRFILKIEEAGIISRVSFSSSHGSVISPCRYREMIYGEDCEKLSLQRIGEILGMARVVETVEDTKDLEMTVQSRVPSGNQVYPGGKYLRIQVFRVPANSFFARPVPLIFYSSLDWGKSGVGDGLYRGPPKSKVDEEGGWIAMAKTKHPDAKPAYSLEKELVRLEIESGLKAGVEKLSGNVEIQNDREKNFHNTRYLLKQYRRVEYSVRVSESELNLRMEMKHGMRLSTLEVNADLAGVDLTGTKLESHARSVIRSKNMLEIINTALEAVREDPDRGELLYLVLYHTYFTKQKPKNRDQILRELEMKGFPMSVSSYHNYLNAAVKAIDRILWGYTARDCIELIKQFLPD